MDTLTTYMDTPNCGHFQFDEQTGFLRPPGDLLRPMSPLEASAGLRKLLLVCWKWLSASIHGIRSESNLPDLWVLGLHCIYNQNKASIDFK